MKQSKFKSLLLLSILMLLGAASLPLIDIAEQPRQRQGRTLTIMYSWHGASAKVMEQNVTSRIEGLVSAVKGVEEIESDSGFGEGRIVLTLKKNADVSATRFEILSLLRQIHKKLPDGVSYPSLSGGETQRSSQRKNTDILLLTYQINADLTGQQLHEYVSQHIERELVANRDIKRVNITGAQGKYIEIAYDPAVLTSCGVSAGDIINGIRAFMGREEIIDGAVEILNSGNRMVYYLTTPKFSTPLEQIPIKLVGDKMVYLNDLATFTYKDRLPDSYFRVNGLSTIYLNLYIASDADKLQMSKKLRAFVDDVSKNLKQGVYLTLVTDEAEKAQTELNKLVWRTALALLILLAFVWIVSRSWRYLCVIAITLIADILLAALFYWLLDIRLHIFSLAGITVSMGMIIDATVVMVDHYSYYRNRRASLAILAALLTTIGSLVVVWWLPEYLQKDLFDFARIIMVNLSVALLVSIMFAPTLTECLRYDSRNYKPSGAKRRAVVMKRIYSRYVAFTQRRKWIYALILIIAFGIPFHALPDRWGDNDYYHNLTSQKEEKTWYESLYNNTLGSSFFVSFVKPILTKYLGGTMRIFNDSLKQYSRSKGDDEEMKLNIRAQMPVGGSVHELNDKVVILEQFLRQFDKIKRFETHVEPWGATVVVEFTPEALKSGFPFELENRVIGKVISIGGADWATYGVSDRGFSNSLNLQYRSNRIELIGYNYERLYRIAEDVCRSMRGNSRVVDITIETPGYEYQEDEFYMDYNHELMSLYGFDVVAAHSALAEMVEGQWIAPYKDVYTKADMYLRPQSEDKFDLWHVGNAHLTTQRGEAIRFSDFMNIERREAKNIIPKRNQEYVLHVAFNILGSYTYINRYMEKLIKDTNLKLPVGFRCQEPSWRYYRDDGTQYWLLLLIAVIIYFICAVLFESLTIPLSILSLVPVSFIGAFLTYIFTGVPFGTGGFAALVLLCGLTVNAAIYIVAEFQNQSKKLVGQKDLVRCYVRAYNHKITAVFLTLLSTVLGLIPFFIDSKSDSFWFSFAVGASGGLVFSIVALVFVVPICLKLIPKKVS